MKQFCIILLLLPLLTSSNTPYSVNRGYAVNSNVQTNNPLNIHQTINTVPRTPSNTQYPNQFNQNWNTNTDPDAISTHYLIPPDRLHNYNDANSNTIPNKNIKEFKRPAVMEGGLLSARVPQHTLIAIDRFLKILKSFAGFAIALAVSMPIIHGAASTVVLYMSELVL